MAEHGLYVDSLIYEIEDQDIKFDENYRKQLEEKADKEGLENLYNMAKKIDEEAVKKISPNDKKRILRILEIYHATGKNKTWQEQESRKNPVEYDYKVFAINWDREKLYERINKRVDIMLKSGLEDEAKYFYNKNRDAKSLRTVIGYKELFLYFDKKISKEEAIDLIKKNSRHYAKRQYTWFNNKLNLNWFNVDFNNFDNTINDVENKINDYFFK